MYDCHCFNPILIRSAFEEVQECIGYPDSEHCVDMNCDDSITIAGEL